jgi:cytoplasmic iron level regulating protein YaaA (DUF328/UPF0246 family)
MRKSDGKIKRINPPQLISKTELLARYLKSLSVAELQTIMSISSNLAIKTHSQIAEWSTEPDKQSIGLDSFIGDIYSGLQVKGLTREDRRYANEHLYILSGLYGLIRPLDTICSYRLEMGYKLTGFKTPNLYKFWGNEIANCLPKNQIVVNTSSVEYSRTVLPYIEQSLIFTPKFLTISSTTKKPTFVTVHSKIARGSFARWLITDRVENAERFSEFKEIGYEYSPELSNSNEPTYVAEHFGGLGLSVRLT